MSDTHNLLRVNVGSDVDLIDLSQCDVWPLRGQVNIRDVELDDHESRYLLPGVQFISDDGRPIVYRTLLRTEGGRYLIVGAITAPVNRNELHPQIVLHVQVSRSTARRLLIKSHFANDPSDRYELPEDLKDLGTAADPRPDEDPVRPMIPSRPSKGSKHPRVRIDFDPEGFRLIVCKLEAAIEGLKQATLLAADITAEYKGDDPDFVWKHVLGNGSDYGRHFSHLFELASLLDAVDSEDLRGCSNYAVMLGPKATALANQAQVDAENLRSMLGNVVGVAVGLEAQFLGPRGQAGYWPAVEDEHLTTLGVAHRRLSRILSQMTPAPAGETSDLGPSAPLATPVSSPNGEPQRVAIPQEPDIAELVEIIRFKLNAPMQAALVEYFADKRKASIEEVKRKVQGDKDKTEGSVRRLVNATNNSLASLASTLRFATKAGYVIKETPKE